MSGVGSRSSEHGRWCSWILAGAGAFLLLIACVNVGGLLLSLIGRRQTEMAVRTAPGAGWLRLLRQLLSESMLLALLGAGGGILVALLGFELLLALHPPGFPRFEELGISPGSFLYSLVFAAGAGLLMGSLTALTGWKSSPMETLRKRQIDKICFLQALRPLRLCVKLRDPSAHLGTRSNST